MFLKLPKRHYSPGYEFADPDVAFFYIATEAGAMATNLIVLFCSCMGRGDTIAAQADIRVLYSMGNRDTSENIFEIAPYRKTPYVSTIIVALITIPLLLYAQDISSRNFGALIVALMHVALAYRLVKVEHKPLSIVMPIIGFV